MGAATPPIAGGQHHPLEETGTETETDVVTLLDAQGVEVQDVTVMAEGKSIQHSCIRYITLMYGSRGDGSQNPGNNLHVSGLSLKIDNRELEALFAKVGRVRRYTDTLFCLLSFILTTIYFQVQKASVMHDPHSRESRGFGFVTMETGEEADAAITALNSTEQMGKVMTVEKACAACQIEFCTLAYVRLCVTGSTGSC